MVTAQRSCHAIVLVENTRPLSVGAGSRHRTVARLDEHFVGRAYSPLWLALYAALGPRYAHRRFVAQLSHVAVVCKAKAVVF